MKLTSQLRISILCVGQSFEVNGIQLHIHLVFLSTGALPILIIYFVRLLAG